MEDAGQGGDLLQRIPVQLAAIIDSALHLVGHNVDRLSKAAADITLDSHRLSANIQQAARTISEAAERLAGAPRA